MQLKEILGSAIAIFYKFKIYSQSHMSFYKKVQLYTNIHKKILPVCIYSENGIGAKLIWCLELLMFCEEKNLTPYFLFNYKHSLPDEDYFSRYYISSLAPNKRYIRIKYIQQLGLKKNYNTLLTISKANELITKYFVLNADLKMYINNYCAINFNQHKVLGIHYRGTDKSSEAEFVSYEKAFNAIQKCFEYDKNFTRLFVTTDDLNFLSFLSETQYSNIIITHTDYFRSDDNISIHSRKELNKYEINKDAIINIYLLSKCDFVIKSASIMSSISLLINPNIPYIMLNKPYDKALWFPEKELLKRVAFNVE